MVNPCKCNISSKPNIVVLREQNITPNLSRHKHDILVCFNPQRSTGAFLPINVYILNTFRYNRFFGHSMYYYKLCVLIFVETESYLLSSFAFLSFQYRLG